MGTESEQLVLAGNDIMLDNQARTLTPRVAQHARQLMLTAGEARYAAFERLARMLEREFAPASVHARMTWVPLAESTLRADGAIVCQVAVVPDGCIAVGGLIVDPWQPGVLHGDEPVELLPARMPFLGMLAAQHRRPVDVDALAARCGLQPDTVRIHLRAVDVAFESRLFRDVAIQVPAPGKRVLEVARVQPAPEDLRLSATFLQDGLLTHDPWRREMLCGEDSIHFSPAEQRALRPMLLRFGEYVSWAELERYAGHASLGSCVSRLLGKVNRGPLCHHLRMELDPTRGRRLRAL